MLDKILDLSFAKELIVLIISTLPIAELRGSIPVAINMFHFPWYYALLLAIIGNLIPVPFLLLFLDSLARFLSRFSLTRRFMNWVFERTRKQGKHIGRYKEIGLAIFVAIPLPGTGAWTASLVAVLLGMKFTRSFLAITVGVVIAGVIVICLALLGWIGAIIAGVGLSALAAYTLWKT